MNNTNTINNKSLSSEYQQIYRSNNNNNNINSNKIMNDSRTTKIFGKFFLYIFIYFF